MLRSPPSCTSNNIDHVAFVVGLHCPHSFWKSIFWEIYKTRSNSVPRIKQNKTPSRTNTTGGFPIQGYRISARYLDIYRVHAFFATLGTKGDNVAFTYIVHQAGDMHKNFFARSVVHNKAKAFGLIKELDRASLHK